MDDVNRRPTAGIAVLFALLATAGGGQTTPTTPREVQARPSTAPPMPPAPTRPDPLTQRLCDALHAIPANRKSQCCGSETSSLAGVCAQELSAALLRGAVTLDAAAIDRCAAETSRQLQGCDWVTPLMPELPDACRRLVHGERKAGARCRSSLECRDGLFCKGAGPSREGACAAPGAARTRCEVPADNLAAFTRVKDDPAHPVCDGLCVKGQCLPFASAGGACPSSAQCAPGLNCVSGRCQERPLPKVGEPCAGNTICAAGAYCQAGECAPLKNTGERCRLPFECRALECVKAPGAPGGTCGEPCGPSFSAPPKPGPPAR